MARNSRLDLYKRRNAGQRLVPELRDKLASALAVFPSVLEFLSLEESDGVRERASSAFPPRTAVEGYHGDYPFLSRQLMSSELTRLHLPRSERSAFLILPEADMVGVLQLPLSVMNTKWGNLLNAKSDGFIVVDAAFANKAVFQTAKDGPSADMVVDVAAWGLEWSWAVRNRAEARQ